MDPRIARTQAAVRRAACDLLVEGGPSAVTVDAVVARSGVAKSTIYRHWETRDDLLVDSVTCMVPSLEPPPAELPFEPALRQLMAQIVETMADPEWNRVLPAIFMLKFTEPHIAGLQEQMQGEQHGIVEEVMKRGVAEGVLPAGLEVEEVAAQLFGPLLLAMLSGRPPLDAAFGDRLVDHFLLWASAAISAGH
jgi:AcrR family transcriptional regulator